MGRFRPSPPIGRLVKPGVLVPMSIPLLTGKRSQTADAPWVDKGCFLSSRPLAKLLTLLSKRISGFKSPSA